jgi:hypothetical protein
MQNILNRIFSGFISILMCYVFLPACNNQSGAELDNSASKTEAAAPTPLVFDKLVGTWLLEDGKTFEQWTKNADGTYQSIVFSIKGNDTSYNEKAKTYKENENWVFENTVYGQNDGKAIKFTSTKQTEITVQFSNPAHDFPTDINYTLPDANTISAFIIGPNKNGGKDTIPYNYKRVK